MSEPIRVLQIVAGMDCGGIENFLMNVYRQIDRSRVQFDFLYHTAQPCFFDAEIGALGGKIYRFPMSEDVNLPAYCRFLDGFFAAHREFACIHGHYSLFGVFYNHYAKKHGVAVRAGHSHTTAPVGAGLNRAADAVLTPLFCRGLTDRFACSAAAGKYLFGKKAFTVCPNGIDADHFAFDAAQRAAVRARYGIPAEAFVVGSVGQFRPEKNQAWLVERFAEACRADLQRDWRLLLVGDGAARGAIKAAAAAHGAADRLLLAGVQADTAPFYSAMDLFALPSVFEGLGIAAVEAQAAGLPCVVSGGVPREADVSGRVRFCPLTDPQGFTAALCAPAARAADGPAAVRRAGYDIRQSAALLQRFYEDAAKRKEGVQ